MDRDALTVVPEAAAGVSTADTALALAQPQARLAAFRALRSRPFRIYFAGQVVSASGTFLQQSAIGWLVFQLTGSAMSLGLVLAAGGVPSLLLGPWGGSIADRIDLRRLLIMTQIAFGLLATALWIAAAAMAAVVDDVGGRVARVQLRGRVARLREQNIPRIGTYGLMSTLLSIGSIFGSLGVGLIHHPRRIYLVAACLAFGLSLAVTAVAPNVALACTGLALTGTAAFCFVTLCSTTLQLHSSAAYRGRIMALWVFVYIGTTPIGSVLTGWITGGAGPRIALLVGALSCLVAAGLGARVQTPPDPDEKLTDLS